MPHPAVVTTVILIRHGERHEPTPADPDPHLNTAGKARAEQFIHVVGQAGIQAIYTSHFVRTRETAQPLATHLGLSMTEMDEALPIRRDIFANHAGATVLVIGHSNTVPDLINQLGAGSVPVIDQSKFDNLFVVNVFTAGEASVTRLKYGQ